MGSDLEAAVARLERDLDAIAAETPGAREARGDVRLLLADWQRLRETETGDPESTANRRVAAAIAERDAARAEVERLKGSLLPYGEAAHALNIWAWRGRVGEAVESIVKFTTHGDGCSAVKVIGRFGSRSGLRYQPGDAARCDCGLSAAIKATRLDPGENPLKAELARLRERDARVRTKVEALQQCIHSEACMTSEDGWTSHHPDCQELREALALLKETP